MNKRFKPQYLPYNNDAHALVEALAAELGLSLKGITGAKHKTTFTNTKAQHVLRSNTPSLHYSSDHVPLVSW